MFPARSATLAAGLLLLLLLAHSSTALKPQDPEGPSDLDVSPDTLAALASLGFHTEQKPDGSIAAVQGAPPADKPVLPAPPPPQPAHLPVNLLPPQPQPQPQPQAQAYTAGNTALPPGKAENGTAGGTAGEAVKATEVPSVSAGGNATGQGTSATTVAPTRPATPTSDVAARYDEPYYLAILGASMVLGAVVLFA